LKDHFDSEPPTNGKGEVWEEPEELPGLPPVPEWTIDLAPETLAPWLVDVAQRIQCPGDFPPVPAYISAAALIGTQCGIRPGRKNDWTVVPNLWGMCIGRPSAMKTPPTAEVLKPLRRLEMKSREDYETRAFDRTAIDMQQKALKKSMEIAASQGAKQGKAPDLSKFRQDHDNHKAELKDANARRRYIVQDCTTERLGEILSENPRGLMLYRDELKGWLRSLDKAGREGDRALYLETWNGTGSFVYDRVERGEIPIPSACVSIFGTIQPGPLRSLLRASVEGTADDDGMIQRFQLMVYPDRLGTWRNVDQFPDSEAKQAAWAVYQRLANATAEDFGATTAEDRDANTSADAAEHGTADIPFLRFTPKAQKRWDTWRHTFENRLLQGEEHPAFEAHLVKYRSLVPSLALVNHLIDTGSGPVELDALERAIRCTDHLEIHARRVYSSIAMPDVDAAKALLAKLKAGRVREDGEALNPFQARHIYRKGWAGLTEPATIHTAIDLLQDFGWVQRRLDDHTGGRDRADIHCHPDIVKGWK
jgi:putative DNA primase/helicase